MTTCCGFERESIVRGAWVESTAQGLYIRVIFIDFRYPKFSTTVGLGEFKYAKFLTYEVGNSCPRLFEIPAIEAPGCLSV